MPKCNMDCLNCSFDKCLDEMTNAERRVALGKGYTGRGNKKKPVGCRGIRSSQCG